MRVSGIRVSAIAIGFAVDYVSSMSAAIAFSAAAMAWLRAQGAPEADVERLFRGADAPLAFQVTLLILGTGGTLLGGYVAGRLGRHAPALHGFALGLVSLALGWVAGDVESAPAWYQLTAYATVVPTAVLGAFCVRREEDAADTPPIAATWTSG
jgi:ABC-type lipoprotein release transport system permease subunit